MPFHKRQPHSTLVQRALTVLGGVVLANCILLDPTGTANTTAQPATVQASAGGQATAQPVVIATPAQSGTLVVATPAQPIANAPVIAVQSVFGGPRPVTGNALRGTIYALQDGTANLQEPSRLQPIATAYSTQLNVPTRAWTAGFPGVPNDRVEWFQVEYDGNVSFTRSGTYDFRLVSDDGSRLWIDGQLVVDGDGLHPTREARGAATLSQGVHSVRVQYFQGPREEIALQLFVTPPGQPERIADFSNGL